VPLRVTEDFRHRLETAAFSPRSAVVTTNAAAPSLSDEAFAAVTVPSLLNAPLRLANYRSSPCPAPLGIDDDVSLFARDLDRTISSAKSFAPIEACARLYEVVRTCPAFLGDAVLDPR